MDDGIVGFGLAERLFFFFFLFLFCLGAADLGRPPSGASIAEKAENGWVRWTAHCPLLSPLLFSIWAVDVNGLRRLFLV